MDNFRERNDRQWPGNKARGKLLTFLKGYIVLSKISLASLREISSYHWILVGSKGTSVVLSSVPFSR